MFLMNAGHSNHEALDAMSEICTWQAFPLNNVENLLATIRIMPRTYRREVIRAARHIVAAGASTTSSEATLLSRIEADLDARLAI